MTELTVPVLALEAGGGLGISVLPSLSQAKFPEPEVESLEIGVSLRRTRGCVSGDRYSVGFYIWTENNRRGCLSTGLGNRSAMFLRSKSLPYAWCCVWRI